MYPWTRIIAALAVILLACQPVSDSFTPRSADPMKPRPDAWLIAFYNVENLYDTLDDPRTDDQEWLPGAEVGWNTARYQTKLSNLARAIASIGGQGPDVLGMCEVENVAVLRDLIAQDSLAAHRYAIVHEESQDERGVDVALIYDQEVVTYRRHSIHNYTLPGNPDDKTRPILQVETRIHGETVFFLVNHWPSRREGEEASEPNRVAAATKARELITTLHRESPKAHIILMGDFNDDPSNRSIREVIGARSEPQSLPEQGFYNPMAALHDRELQGTLTYQGKWNLFDQIILSASLCDPSGSLRYRTGSATIHDPEFMQVGGTGRAQDAPRRAVFRGEFQDNGYSDHFPVFLRLEARP
ncbi:MAG: hypothetical protein SF053_21700 [Bacteroidia bacterium]|nr:hypothetical protein [Bacteroidia bacterium]